VEREVSLFCFTGLYIFDKIDSHLLCLLLKETDIWTVEISFISGPKQKTIKRYSITRTALPFLQVQGQIQVI